jgi:HPt (histidine-containing phosphotransfer) domain-containing protein
MMAQGVMANSSPAPNGVVRSILQVNARKPACGSARARPKFRFPDALALQTRDFDQLIEMLGEDGVREMLEIFETETRRRLLRLATGGQDTATLIREMHTLKGAAGTVAAPRLAALGRSFEQAAREGIVPVPDDLQAIEDALEAFLAAIRDRDTSRFQTGDGAG